MSTLNKSKKLATGWLIVVACMLIQAIPFGVASNIQPQFVSYVVEEKGFTLVPSRYIEFVNRDENIDFDTKMKSLQGELKELLVQEEKSKADLLAVFKELGYEIEL